MYIVQLFARRVVRRAHVVRKCRLEHLEDARQA